MATARMDNFLENFGCEEEERGLQLQEVWGGEGIFLRWGKLESAQMFFRDEVIERKVLTSQERDGTDTLKDAREKIQNAGAGTELDRERTLTQMSHQGSALLWRSHSFFTEPTTISCSLTPVQNICYILFLQTLILSSLNVMCVQDSGTVGRGRSQGLLGTS